MIIDAVTKRRVDVYFREVTKEEIRANKYNKRGGWAFNWLTPLKDGFRVFALITETEPEVAQGLIAMRALHDPDFNCVHLENIEAAPQNKRFLGPKGFNNAQRYENVGKCLVAFACQYSLDQGLEGYVELIAKNSVLQFYSDLGGIPFGRKVIFDERGALRLIRKHFPGGAKLWRKSKI
ncbi:hypothetical protein LCY76_23615 [Fictibacillus sp. KIGAM418]|uniref:Uncharacterized protein n=1 Tax=Fictibacillus marinisediminis TaxID=2878389 RepID=A0A9X1XG59_9BACL|nr:hypothetical protein [Fictibacillus marinisediminis]MCK6259561.1 hypothetical protein [Fictibacillus marinisediminis]